MSGFQKRGARLGSRGLTLLQTALVALTVLWAGEAAAQFTNHTIGFDVGYLSIDRSVGAESGPVLGLESTLYIESGFDLYFRVLAGIHKEVNGEKQNAIGFFPGMGVRYLFSEEDVRPYLGASLTYLQFFGAATLPTTLRVAVSPFAGLEIYVQSNTAIGFQAEYQRIIELNGNGGNAFGFLGRVSWGF